MKRIIVTATEHPGEAALDWRTLDLAGKSAIEASAGTGKTYTLVLLVVRLLLERELPPSAILLATFTEAATLELRARVTERVRQAYFAALSPTDPKRRASTQNLMANNDPLAQYLYARWQSRGKVNVRLRDEKILERAMLQMDDMPIRTLHGLCRQLLSSFDLVPSDIEAAIEDGAALTEAALDDAFRRRFTDVRALTDAQLDALDSSFLRALRDGIKRVLQNGRITLRTPVNIDAQRYSKARTALFSTKFRKALAEVLDEVPDPLQLRADTRRALKNLLRTLKLGAQQPLPNASLELFVLPEATQKKAARQSVLQHRTMAELCHFAQLHQLAVRAEFASLLNSLVAEVRLSRSSALAARGGVSFDSMIEQLAERLAPRATQDGEEFERRPAVHSTSAEQLANAIHQRYPVALIDEFQDTDAQQWAILQAIYGARGGLILVGDPKQSIYRFRGSDVHTFVRATKECDRYFLQHNYRATAELVGALNGFYSAVAKPFHSAEIAFRSVQVGRIDSDGLVQTRKPLCFIEITDPDQRYTAVDACLRAACSDIKQSVQVHDRRDAMFSTAPPSIALFVSSNRLVRAAQDYLRELGVHALASASLGVYQSEAAQVLQCMLCALAAPADLTRARAARLALQLDTLDRVSALDERALFRWIEHYLAQMLARGISYVCLSLAIERVSDAQFVSDTNHLAELLALDEQALLDAQPGLRENSAAYAQALWQSLSTHIEQPDRNPESHERRRISAGARVQVMTVHKAKGLEFDEVYLPTLSFAAAADTHVAIIPGAHGLECDAGSADFENAIAMEADEALAELLRLQYVALTRAKQTVNVYFHTEAVKDKSALGWHLAQVAGYQRAQQVQETTPEPAWEDQINAVPERVAVATKLWRAGLERFAEHENMGFVTREVADFVALTPTEPAIAAPKPTAAQLNPLPTLRPLQRRISFSSMTQIEVKTDAAESESLPPSLELVAEMAAAPPDLVLAEIESRNAQPEIVALEKFRGPNFGLALHALFEDALVATTHLDAEQVITRLSQFGLTADALSAQAILALLLGNRNKELLPELSLAGLNATNCIAELGFQLPVQGLDYRALAELGPRFGLPLLFQPELAFERVNGMLIGFIDLVFQRHGKFYLLDYKSNWLGASLQDYRGTALEAGMAQHYYHLQHLLYALALHRYLRHSLPDYDFETHFGGAHYLFVRAFGINVSGADSAGHYQYRAPRALIEALDLMFAG
jgi:exodeoxyribonuclease V beta subunit